MTTRERTGTCDETTFWEAVAELNWAEAIKGKNPYKTVKTHILTRWDDSFARSFDDMVREKVGHLCGVIEGYEEENGVSCECGDDGFSDLRYHIVGLGKDEYEAVLADPMRAVKRGQEGDYYESFSYCLPHLPEKENADLTLEEARAKVIARNAESRWHDDEEECVHSVEMQALTLIKGDRTDVDPAYYAAWAKRELEDIKVLADSPFADAVGREDLTLLLESLTKVAEGDVFVQWADMKKRVARVMKKREAILKQRRAELEAQLAVLNYPYHASMENLFGDGAANFGEGR